MLNRVFRILFVLTTTLCLTATIYGQDDAPAFAGTAFEGMTWEEIVAEADGQTVNWYIWGGSPAINEFVDTFYGPVLAEEYNITLNRVPVSDTVDAVNLVLNELDAGVEADGSVDMIWINGENFFTLRQADALFGPWAEQIPNAALVDWENPAVAFDFGFPVEGYESPWSSAQFQLVYDTARMSEEDLPSNFEELTAYIEANPGRFTYIAPGPGGFVGTRFLKGALYSLSGGVEPWTGEWDADLFETESEALWDLLNTWEPNLWRAGEDYPANENELHQLFANGEVDFTMVQAAAGAGPAIEAGLLPPTARAFVFDAYMIGDYNYVAVPSNAPNPAAALVTANLLLRPDRQAGHILPASGFGLGYAIDITRVEDGGQRELLETAFEALGEGAADPEALAASFAPDMAPESQAAMEQGWETNTLQN